MITPLSLRHTYPNLLIPWNQVSPITKKPAFFGISSYEFKVGTEAQSVTVAVCFDELADAIEAGQLAANQTASLVT